LTTLNLPINTIQSDRFFYDHFEYCFVFRQNDAGALRKLTHQYVSSAVESRRAWWKMRRLDTSLIKDEQITTPDAELEARLHDLCDFLLEIVPAHKIVINYNEIRIYTNSIDLIKEWAVDPQFNSPRITQAVIVRPKDTITLRNPQHKFRAYFRSTHITAAEKSTLKNFLDSQKAQIRIGPALNQWLLNHWLWTMDTFFIDYDSEQWLFMLALVRPGLIRKSMAIIQAK